MTEVVNAVIDTTTGLTPAGIVTPITNMVPFYVMAIPLVLFIHFYRKAVVSITKGRVNI